MKKTRNLLLLTLLSVVLLPSCSKKPSSSVDLITSTVPGPDSSSLTSTTSTIGGSSTGPSTTKVPTTSGIKPDSTPSSTTTGPYQEFTNYDAYIDEYSKSGHLYIHYKRPGATIEDYNRYGLWLWPTGGQGALFAASTTVNGITASTNSWMTNIGVNGPIDQAGVCAEIDLNSTSYVSGKTGGPFSLSGLNRIGYLVVQLSSMGGSTHWVSDGGGDAFIEDIDVNVRANGAIHVFLNQGEARFPSYYYSEETYTNPVLQDTTGAYRSTSDVESSKNSFDQFATSQKFKTTSKNGYQIFIPTFCDSNGDGFGDLRGIINKLDYLEALHIDTLWLSPFLKSNSYHGYDTVDFYQIDERIGTVSDLKELIFKAHQKGMKLVMDFVINHASSSSIWFKKAQRGETGIDKYGNVFKYRDLFHFKMKGDKNGTGSKNVEDDPDWFRDGESNYYYYAKFASDMPELNYDAKITRDMIMDVAYYWLGFGFDGYRVDAIKHIYMADEANKSEGDSIIEDVSTKVYYDEQLGKEVTKTVDYSTNTTKNLAFWMEMQARIKAVYPDAYLVGENFDGYDLRISPYYSSFDSQFDFNAYYHHFEYAYLNLQGKNASSIATENNQKFGYFKNHRSDFINATFTSNHDVSRAINHINSTKSGNDTVDVKITGTVQQVSRAKMHAAMTILQPGVSYIYYGDELGMSSNTSENTLDHDNSIDRFYRQPMKWADPSERAFISFGEGYNNNYDSYNKLLDDAETQAGQEKSMLSFYQDLNKIKADPLFPVDGTYQGYNYESNGNVYHCVISNDRATYRIFINTGGPSGTGSAPYGINPDEETVFSYNATSSSINPYGVVVVRSVK